MFPAGFRDQSPRDVSALLRARGIRPSKALGQNFLADGNVLDLIVRAADLPPGAEVVEIGPGLGALTARLLAAGARVTAVEKDPALHPLLLERFGGEPRFSLVRGDALEQDWASFFAPPDEPGGDGGAAGRAKRLVSNLPYSVGTRVVVDAASCAHPPAKMTLLLQKEVGDRFAAPEGTPARGAVSVLLQRLYDVETVRDVPPSCFVPRPEVTSVILVLTRHARHPLAPPDADRFRALVKAAFQHRRKQLASSLRAAPDGLARPADAIRAALAAVGAPETARPEDLSVARWCDLAVRW